MKLLFFIQSMSNGGAERVTASLANYWAEKGWQVTVVTLTSSMDDFYQLHPAVNRIALNIAGDSSGLLSALVNNLRRIKALRCTLRQVQPDVALAMMSTANILLAFASGVQKGLVTIGSERTYPPRVPLGRVWEKLRSWSYGYLDVMVALTDESADWLRSHTRARSISVIPNAAQWPLPIQEPRRPPPVRSKDQHVLLAVGRLSEEKGFHLLIQCFQLLFEDYPDWRLVILGEGLERSNLESQVSDAGLAEFVSLPGRVGNVGQWYEAADLYVMSSRFEGFPNTLVEAMAHGLPAISFDCDTGPRDIIRHGVDGLLVKAGCVEALEAALRTLMGNHGLRIEFAEKATEVRCRYSSAMVVARWESIIAKRDGCASLRTPIR